MNIPAIVMEEHNEAFLCWNAALRKGVLPAIGNLLLHFDEHCDLGEPDFKQPLHLTLASASLEPLREVIYTQLAIAEFILPAAYQQLVDRMCWIKFGMDGEYDDQLYVGSEHGKGTAIRSSLVPNEFPDAKPFVVFRRSPFHASPESESVLLDIDLDGFACNPGPGRHQRLEITRNEFDDYRDDRHHFLRTRMAGEVEISEEDGRYYVYFERTHSDRDTLNVPWWQVQVRIEGFRRFLQRSEIRPKLVTIARSNISGYTPSHFVDRLETAVRCMLQSLYALEFFDVDSFCRD